MLTALQAITLRHLAGLSYTLEQLGDGILLTSDGYNHKMFVLLEAVTKRMKEVKVDVKRIANAVDQVRSTFIPSLEGYFVTCLKSV
jgi:secreted Zn-dependent insulinase-like peptidase